MKKLDLKSYKYVICESIEALNWFKKNGLKKNIKVLSSSPAMLFKDSSIINLDKSWTKKKMQSFTSEIDPINRIIFKKLILNKKIKKEEALVVIFLITNYFKILYKAGSINKKILESKVLNIKLEGTTGRKSLDINTPWEKIFKYSKNLDHLSYNFSYINKKQGLLSAFENIIYRLKLIDLESIMFKLVKKVKKKKYTINKNIFLLGENELLKETASHMSFSGFGMTNFFLEKKKFIVNNNFKLVKKIICKDLKKLTSKWVVKELVKACEEIFYKNLADELNNYLSSKYNTIDYLSEIKLKDNILFSSIYLNSKLLGILEAFKKYKVPIISFQHGVTPEISGASINIAAVFPANYCDYFIYFNSAAANTAKKQAFINNKSFVSGLPKKYFITKKSGLRLLSNKKEIIYLSMNLYRGFFAGFNGYLNDFSKAKEEISFIEDVLCKIPYKVDYKPYVLENIRYLDQDPTLEFIEKYPNLHLINNKIDARFILSKYRLIITTHASSTLSWVLLSEIPIIFINSENTAPLRESLKKEIKEAIFYFDESEFNHKKKLIKFLSQPIAKLEVIYKNKKIKRIDFIKKYFSKYKGEAGKRIKKFVLKKYL